MSLFPHDLRISVPDAAESCFRYLDKTSEVTTEFAHWGGEIGQRLSRCLLTHVATLALAHRELGVVREDGQPPLAR